MLYDGEEAGFQDHKGGRTEDEDAAHHDASVMQPGARRLQQKAGEKRGLVGWLTLWPVAPLLTASLFLGLTLPQISVPHLNPEEMDESLRLSYLLTTPSSQVDSNWYTDESCLHMFGRYWPLMDDNSYCGATISYLQQPLFALFGQNVFAVRLLPILVVLGALLAMIALIRHRFGPWVALVTGLLTATHPIMVHFSRLGRVLEEMFTVGFLWGGLYCIHRHAKGGARATIYLGVAFFLFGTGLNHKITFLWYVLGLTAVSLVFRKSVFKGWRGRDIAAAASGLALGVAPIALYNMKSGWQTVRLLARSLVEPTPKDHINNMHYLDNLWFRIQQFVLGTVGGDLWDVGRLLNFEHGMGQLLLFICLFIAGYVLLPILAWRGRLPYPTKSIAAVFLFYTVVFLCSPMTVSRFWVSHLDVMFPFPQLVVALMVVAVPCLVRGRGMAWIAAGLVVIALVWNVGLTVHYHRAAARAEPHPMQPWAPLRFDHRTLRINRSLHW